MYKKYFKRIFDLVIVILALPFWMLILLVVGPIIYASDRGPIFYNAYRLGKNKEVFKMYKFRSMKVNAPDIRNDDGSTFNAEDDPRLTKIGIFLRKSSIDETPQILNIIKGNMSIIGPRPDLPEHFNLYEGNESRKLEVRPGLTGYNQAYFRNTVPWKERIRNDIYYVDNLTILMDLKIFIKTISVVLKREAVFSNSKNDDVSGTEA